MHMTEPNIFTQFMEKRKVIVKNKKILQSSYIPDNLPHRMDKINEIVEIIAPALITHLRICAFFGVH